MFRMHALLNMLAVKDVYLCARLGVSALLLLIYYVVCHLYFLDDKRGFIVL
jgi:hypothetical protein